MGYSNRFMQDMGLQIPILQAPVGAAAGPDLAEAVGAAGGMGSVPLTNMSLPEALAVVSRLKTRGVPFFVNFVLVFGDETIRAVAGARPPAITLSWGLDRALVADIRASGVRVGLQVGSQAGAEAALAAGADFLIAQGMEAGGHVQSSTPLAVLLPQVVDLAGTVPVVAAGGIATGAAIAAALNAGAQAVTMGTRFVATRESSAHDLYKQALVQAAGPETTALTNCFDGGWPYAMHRVLRNSTLTAWEAAGCPAAPHRPGEGDVLARAGGAEVRRYDDTPPFAGLLGQIEGACLYAGTGVGAITAIESAATLMARLWDEAQTDLRRG